jgi:threonine/homoserine/homoserine lactone efflux protein
MKLLLFLSIPAGALAGGTFMLQVIEAAGPQMDKALATALLIASIFLWPVLVVTIGPRITGEKVKTNDSTAWVIFIFCAVFLIFQAVKP